MTGVDIFWYGWRPFSEVDRVEVTRPFPDGDKVVAPFLVALEAVGFMKLRLEDAVALRVLVGLADPGGCVTLEDGVFRLRLMEAVLVARWPLDVAEGADSLVRSVLERLEINTGFETRLEPI